MMYERKNIPSTPLRRFAKWALKLLGLYDLYINTRENWKHKKLHTLRVASILSYKNRFSPKIFIETGTYKGEMIDTMLNKFNKIYSIELGDDLYKAATKKYANQNHVRLLHGDSALVLPEVLSQINEPALFWLDAHFSGGETVMTNIETPIEAELKAIFSHHIKNHVILIDDAREFVGKNGYPKVNVVEKMALDNGYLFENKDDNLRIYPKK